MLARLPQHLTVWLFPHRHYRRASFAQWSLLRNLTVSVVIFFTYPARSGDKIRILDGENTLEDTTLGINMFQVLLENNGGNIINFPNNLLIQKAFVKLKEEA